MTNVQSGFNQKYEKLEKGHSEVTFKNTQQEQEQLQIKVKT